jgi:hypothetical protein
METFGEFASLRQVLRNLALYWDKRSPGWLEISMQEGNGSIFHNIWSSIHAIKIPSFGTSLHELWYQFCYINAFYPWLSLSFFYVLPHSLCIQLTHALKSNVVNVLVIG